MLNSCTPLKNNTCQTNDELAWVRLHGHALPAGKSEKIRNLTLVVISRRITMLTFRMVRYELRCTVTVKIYGDKNVR